MENSATVKSSQKIHLCSFLVISVTGVVQEPGQSTGATENLVLMVRCFVDDTDCSVLLLSAVPQRFQGLLS